MPPRTEAPSRTSGHVVNMQGVTVGFVNMPNGNYPATFVGGEWKEGEKGEFFAADFVISDPEEYAGKHRSKTWSLSEGALPGVKGDLVALGADPDELDKPDVDLDPIFASLEGTPCFLDIIDNKKTGYNEIRKITREG